MVRHQSPHWTRKNNSELLNLLLSKVWSKTSDWYRASETPNSKKISWQLKRWTACSEWWLGFKLRAHKCWPRKWNYSKFVRALARASLAPSKTSRLRFKKTVARSSRSLITWRTIRPQPVSWPANQLKKFSSWAKASSHTLTTPLFKHLMTVRLLLKNESARVLNTSGSPNVLSWSRRISTGSSRTSLPPTRNTTIVSRLKSWCLSKSRFNTFCKLKTWVLKKNLHE